MDLPGILMHKGFMKSQFCSRTIFDHDHVSAMLSDGQLLSRHIWLRDNHICGKVE